MGGKEEIQMLLPMHMKVLQLQLLVCVCIGVEEILARGMVR